MTERLYNARHMVDWGGDQATNALYIGRKNARGLRVFKGSKWANPYKIGSDGDRVEVLVQYADYVWNRDDLRRALHEIEGHDLICWCTPPGGLPRDREDALFVCHGQVLWILLDRMNALVEAGADKHVTTLRPFDSGLLSADEYWRELRRGSEWPENWRKLP